MEEIETEKRNNLQMIYNVVGTGGPLPTRTHLPTPNLLYAAGHIQLSNPKCHRTMCNVDNSSNSRRRNKKLL